MLNNEDMKKLLDLVEGVNEHIMGACKHIQNGHPGIPAYDLAGAQALIVGILNLLKASMPTEQ